MSLDIYFGDDVVRILRSVLVASQSGYMSQERRLGFDLAMHSVAVAFGLDCEIVIAPHLLETPHSQSSGVAGAHRGQQDTLVLPTTHSCVGNLTDCGTMQPGGGE